MKSQFHHPSKDSSEKHSMESRKLQPDDTNEDAIRKAFERQPSWHNTDYPMFKAGYAVAERRARHLEEKLESSEKDTRLLRARIDAARSIIERQESRYDRLDRLLLESILETKREKAASDVLVTQLAAAREVIEKLQNDLHQSHDQFYALRNILHDTQTNLVKCKEQSQKAKP